MYSAYLSDVAVIRGAGGGSGGAADTGVYVGIAAQVAIIAALAAVGVSEGLGCDGDALSVDGAAA
jgi:hypothetical protein